MFTLKPTHAPVTVTEPVSNVLQELTAIDEAINADGLPCNPDNLWRALLAPENQDVKGDALILVGTLASLEKHQEQGVRVSHSNSRHASRPSNGFSGWPTKLVLRKS
jgi:hypothetical protein